MPQHTRSENRIDVVKEGGHCSPYHYGCRQHLLEWKELQQLGRYVHSVCFGLIRTPRYAQVGCLSSLDNSTHVNWANLSKQEWTANNTCSDPVTIGATLFCNRLLKHLYDCQKSAQASCCASSWSFRYVEGSMGTSSGWVSNNQLAAFLTQPRNACDGDGKAKPLNGQRERGLANDMLMQQMFAN